MRSIFVAVAAFITIVPANALTPDLLSPEEAEMLDAATSYLAGAAVSDIRCGTHRQVAFYAAVFKDFIKRKEALVRPVLEVKISSADRISRDAGVVAWCNAYKATFKAINGTDPN